MSTTFLHPTRETYDHRSTIPLKLRHHFKGRTALGRSPTTKDKDKTILKSARWTARIHQFFLTLKKQGDRMTDKQRERLKTVPFNKSH
ncbi:MAG: hypothetical protein EHM80_03655 [Nitrospiraceae bacterium]|nr:MAG: hypothetical protein EHM80_03655 [Nitrospiraceae bacterium]